MVTCTLKSINLLNSEISFGNVEDRIKSSLKEAKVKVGKCGNNRGLNGNYANRRF
jgi:hypothetical protein